MQNMGSYAGMHLDEFIANGSKFPPDAETMAALRQRGEEFWTSTVVPLAMKGEGGTIVLVSHGAFRQSCLSEGWLDTFSALTGLLPCCRLAGALVLNTFLSLLDKGILTAVPSVTPGKLPNTSVTTIVVDHASGKGEIQSWGDVSHLLIPLDGTSTLGGGPKPTMVGNLDGGE
jgi:broad specificity phosphatase PhoE